jgi:hypothetical protein
MLVVGKAADIDRGEGLCTQLSAARNYCFVLVLNTAQKLQTAAGLYCFVPVLSSELADTTHISA